jgi:Putative DNA-binding domain
MRPSLAAQQHTFFDAVVNFSQPLFDNEHLLSPGRASASEQLSIYRRAYMARLIDCLRDDYPLVELALGTKCFEDLCRGYADAAPPQSNSLNFFGRHFAVFIQARVTPELAWTFALAQVEWALVEAIHADATQVLTPAMFGQFGPEQWSKLRLQPSETLQLLKLEYDIAPLLIEAPQSDAFSRPPLERPALLAICRRGSDVWRLPLEPWAGSLLQMLASAIPLGDALDELPTDTNTSVTEAAISQTFAQWLEAGVFRNVAPD